jgi:hypothetical protein
LGNSFPGNFFLHSQGVPPFGRNLLRERQLRPSLPVCETLAQSLQKLSWLDEENGHWSLNGTGRINHALYPEYCPTIE